ncbi:NarK family nitrate/nitrite MFS transporter [Fodinicurvata sp. EGI_FJ10296]|uniref:NarK family nitrate/nitrite MFS transporter n=1 Tax=Fodinicurvata sp. EGI_FJ10296 TaxID=3231908 RepID=UPI003454F1E0
MTATQSLSADGRVIRHWAPEDDSFWEREGRRVARRNLWISIPALFLAFAVWMIWSVVAAFMPAAGFDFTTGQLFWLAALPGLSGATFRVFYSFMVPIFGGRKWTTISTASLLIPALGIGFALQNPDTPYWIFLILSLACGFGGGNFASSMANISFFFPKREKGNALALNAGLGNLGVSGLQFAAPLVITAAVFGAIGGPPAVDSGDSTIWLQNAAFIWVPFIVLSSIAAWFGMNDLASAKASFADQAAIFRRKHNWVMCWLYVGTFGSFIGYSAALPLLARTQFPDVESLQIAFIGPLLGALTRAGSGWIADRFGGGRVTLWVFVGMALGVVGVIFFVNAGMFWGFFLTFLVLFSLTGVGNASTFQMIPVIFLTERTRAMAGTATDADEIRRTADRESAATIGFTSAIAAYGAFFIPQGFGTSLALTGSPEAALIAFLAFYATCIAVTWWFYTRKNAEIPC